MTPNKAVRRLKALETTTDYEIAHSEADKVLLEVLDTNGLREVADAYRALVDKHGNWPCA